MINIYPAFPHFSVIVTLI